MKKLVLVLLVVALLLVACEPNRPNVPPRHDPIPDNSVPPVEKNVTVPTEPSPSTPPDPTSEPEDVTPPTEPEDIIPTPNVPAVEENVTLPTESENVTLPSTPSENLTEPEEVIPPEEPYIYSTDTFFTDVLVGLESFNPSEEEIEEVMEIASFKFKQLTGYNLELREVSYLNKVGAEGESTGSAFNNFEYKHFLDNNQGLNGVIVLTKKFGTENSGGFSSLLYYPDYCNSFKSVIRDGESNWLYFNYIDWKHKYSTCGYDYENDQHVSSVSIGGECGNQPGTQCIFNGDYYICDYAQEDYYAEENVFVACTIVHEFMHPFGENGNYDHYGTAICNEAMGTTAADSSSEDFQYYCGLCPNVYENFKNSFVDC